MPRRPRVYLPSVPCHIISRGNNRDACFYCDEDYYFYLECLNDACRRYSVELHAYVLMTNHVHLLMSPDTLDGISRVMQSVGRRYVQYVNRLYKRSGTLWEGRYKASLIEAESYLLECYRYIELNPVRASMVEHPKDYPWSSFRANAGINIDPNIIPHELYVRLGDNIKSRGYAYRELFSVELDKSKMHDIRIASSFSLPIGSKSFQQQIQSMLDRKLVKQN